MISTPFSHPLSHYSFPLIFYKDCFSFCGQFPLIYFLTHYLPTIYFYCIYLFSAFTFTSCLYSPFPVLIFILFFLKKKCLKKFLGFNCSLNFPPIPGFNIRARKPPPSLSLFQPSFPLSIFYDTVTREMV